MGRDIHKPSSIIFLTAYGRKCTNVVVAKKPKSNYTMHLRVGKQLAQRINRLAEEGRRTAHAQAIILLEDGVAQKENGNVRQSEVR